MTFASNETLQKAYLGKHAQDLVMKTSDQIGTIYKVRGIIIPVLLSSTLHSLANEDGASLADLSRALDLPHQLVSQRIHKLLGLNLIKKMSDPNDGRRSQYFLTMQGKEQARRLDQCMSDTAEIYQDLYEELGCDLADVLLRAITAIQLKPLFMRFAEKFPQESAA